MCVLERNANVNKRAIFTNLTVRDSHELSRDKVSSHINGLYIHWMLLEIVVSKVC